MFLLDGNNTSFWMQLLTTLKQWDTWLFLKINNEWTNSFLDHNYPWWREASTWYPLYFFLLLFAFINFGFKVWPWVVFFALTLLISDQISSGILKDWIARPRPCNDDVLMSHVHLLLNRCPSSGSFTSSHATNHFAAACFIFYTVRAYFKKWGYLFFIWAATISYGQVYVGVHYPLDIVCGAILGCCIGSLTAYIFNKRVRLPILLSEKNRQVKE
ncbi:MAG TPA: phosphatase PAP2 family protein [Panacibacter sp.]|nr:phosphatase PAP2 family protein [Panacibacter sp.]